MSAKKIDFAQPLLQLNGQPIRRDVLCHPQTIGMVQAVINNALADMQDARKALFLAINERFGEGLTLQEVVCDALTAAYTDDRGQPERISGIDRTKRVTMAIRCNKRGMVKIGDDDIKFIMPIIEKRFLDSLISVQVETLLRGEAFALTAEDDDDKVVPIKDVGNG